MADSDSLLEGGGSEEGVHSLTFPGTSKCMRPQEIDANAQPGKYSLAWRFLLPSLQIAPLTFHESTGRNRSRLLEREGGKWRVVFRYLRQTSTSDSRPSGEQWLAGRGSHGPTRRVRACGSCGLWISRRAGGYEWLVSIGSSPSVVGLPGCKMRFSDAPAGSIADIGGMIDVLHSFDPTGDFEPMRS